MQSRSKRVLFVLAHQDDEVFFSARIEHEARLGHEVWCAFLTDGSGRGVDPRLRNDESRRVLTRLGVPTDRMLFAGGRGSAPDGELPRHLESSLAGLCGALDGLTVHRVFTAAYEGGHQDHDAAHLVALAFARRRGILSRTWETSLYNGCGTPWRFFRVLHPLPGAPRHRRTRRLPLVSAWRHALLPASYPSQWRSWAGLWPGYLIERAVLRRETLQCVDPRRVRGRPHPGSPLYERRTGWTWAAFRAVTAEFAARHVDVPDARDVGPTLDAER